MREHPALRSLRLVSKTGAENRLLTSSVVDLTWLCDLELGRNPLWASGFPLSHTRHWSPCRIQNLPGGWGVTGRNGTTLSPHTADPGAAAGGFHDDL